MSHSPALESPSPAAQRPLRILIAEDEFLVGVMLEENLRMSGHDIVGPKSDLKTLLAAIDTETFDLAIFDINLEGEMVYPAADAVIKRGLPLLLLSGYGGSSVPERFRGLTALAKPCDFRDVEAWIQRATRST